MRISFSGDARGKMQDGVRKIAKAVGSTMGPKGRNVVISHENYQISTKDGVTVAKELVLDDPFEEAGARLVREAAIRTNDQAGDGTTQCCVMVEAMLQSGLSMMAGGQDPVSIKSELDLEVQKAVETLKENAKHVDMLSSELDDIAAISANDRKLGEFIADCFRKIGKDGILVVEEGSAPDDSFESSNGFRIDKGLVSPYMATDPIRMIAEVRDAKILITDRRISTVTDVLPIMEKMNAKGLKNLVIVAEGIEGEALTTLVMNKLKGVFNTFAVLAPKYGQLKKDILQDLATVTGGEVVSQDLGVKLDSVTLDMLGSAEKVVMTRDDMTVIGGKGSEEGVSVRAESIRDSMEGEKDAHATAMLMERYAKLKSGIGVIRVGGRTETEIKEKKQRVEDAVNATRAALEEGYVDGGGVTAYRMSSEFHGILADALRAPIRRIMSNAGKNPSQTLSGMTEGMGYDASADRYVNMRAAGILDPVKVIRCAMTNAASLAGMLLTTEVLAVPKEK